MNLIHSNTFSRKIVFKVMAIYWLVRSPNVHPVWHSIQNVKHWDTLPLLGSMEIEKDQPWPLLAHSKSAQKLTDSNCLSDFVSFPLILSLLICCVRVHHFSRCWSEVFGYAYIFPYLCFIFVCLLGVQVVSKTKWNKIKQNETEPKKKKKNSHFGTKFSNRKACQRCFFVGDSMDFGEKKPFSKNVVQQQRKVCGRAAFGLNVKRNRHIKVLHFSLTSIAHARTHNVAGNFIKNWWSSHTLKTRKRKKFLWFCASTLIMSIHEMPYFVTEDCDDEKTPSKRAFVIVLYWNDCHYFCFIWFSWASVAVIVVICSSRVWSVFRQAKTKQNEREKETY